MKARIQIPSYYEKAIEERVSYLEAESRSRIHVKDAIKWLRREE